MIKNRPLSFIAAVILPPILVTPSRLPEDRALRSVSYITSEEFDRIIGGSITDFADELPSLDVRKRGAFGVQTDLNIRGATFEQSTVLVNGVRMNDPQTAHHNMDMPFTAMDIERLELLRGGGSALYGPDAFGGVLNIITKRPGARKAHAEFAVGQNGYIQGGVSVTQPAGPFKNRISFERKESSGHREATDFEITTVSFDSLLEGEFGEVEIVGGHTFKDFGAATFYSSLYPNEGEYTDTRLGIVRAKLEKDAVTVEPKIYYRRHWDRFVLDRDRRFWQRNTHKTYTFGADVQATIDTGLGTVLFGTELSWDKIVSTNINKHKRHRQALFAGYNCELPFGLAVNAALRGDRFSDFGWEVSPSVSAGYDLNDRVRLRSSVNRSYRIPSFTDLYYVSPANIGNESLKPESARSYEVGLDYRDSFMKVYTTFFARHARDVIDWTRNSAAEAWRAGNRGKIDTIGLESLLELDPAAFLGESFIEKITAGYDLIDAEEKNGGGALSKYAMDYLKYNFHVKIDNALPFDVKNTLKFSYKERIGGQPYFLLDAGIYKRAELAGFDAEFYIEGTNLLNTSYSEISGLPAPGIWITGGVKTEF